MEHPCTALKNAKLTNPILKNTYYLIYDQVWYKDKLKIIPLVVKQNPLKEEYHQYKFNSSHSKVFFVVTETYKMRYGHSTYCDIKSVFPKVELALEYRKEIDSIDNPNYDSEKMTKKIEIHVVPLEE